MSEADHPWGRPLTSRAWHATLRLAQDKALHFAIGVPLLFAVVAAAALLIPATSGLNIWLDLIIAVVASILLVAILFGWQLVVAYVEMLYETRHVVNRLQHPDEETDDARREIVCEVSTKQRDRSQVVSIIVTNTGSTGDYYGRLLEKRGPVTGPDPPWALSWRDHPGERSITIPDGDSEVLELLVIRSSTIVDFVRQGAEAKRAYVEGDGHDECEVDLVVGILSESDEFERRYLLRLTLNAGRPPTIAMQLIQ